MVCGLWIMPHRRCNRSERVIPRWRRSPSPNGESVAPVLTRHNKQGTPVRLALPVAKPVVLVDVLGRGGRGISSHRATSASAGCQQSLGLEAG
ncbi:hypothetical protein ZHAS_00005648 [Anopheles sinensis]|uniref:Uncharacterized protein n=1 Tax=Anopheles sinensis TaxID=74873 RepID=A0A084VK15_ANOSI|nr:hypothetical protein ZHAS_00005648 [Anopheles sinensis]